MVLSVNFQQKIQSEMQNFAPLAKPAKSAALALLRIFHNRRNWLSMREKSRSVLKMC
jgi:hypothetical protein